MTESEISQNASTIEKDTLHEPLEDYDKNDLADLIRSYRQHSLRVSREASLRELEKINEEADRMYGKGSLVSEFIVDYRRRRELE